MMKTNLYASINFSLPRQQSGAVLVLSLILLVVLTMLGISAIESTKLETRMAKNTVEYNKAFQVAEAGLSQIAQNISGIQNIQEGQFLLTPPDPLEITDQHGNKFKAKLDVMKSITEKQSTTTGANRVNLFYVVRSTGYSGVDDENSLEVKLEGGVILDISKSDLTETNTDGCQYVTDCP